MRYFYQDSRFARIGPHSLEELRRLHLSGAIQPDTLVLADDGNETAVPLGKLLEQFPVGTPPPLPGGPLPPPHSSHPPPSPDSFTSRAGDDLRTMLPHLTLPLEELRTFRWVENKKALAIAGVGLLPLIIYAGFGGRGSSIGNAFWAMALYFSVLWALFFYYVFPTPQARVGIASLCFFATGLVSVGVLLHLYRVWPLNAIFDWTHPSHDFLTQWMGFVFAVGIPEELCKAAILFVVIHRFGPLPPQAMLFYGLMAGLGFGIYEGLTYQTTQNFRVAFDVGVANRSQAVFAAEYYLLNLIRLTTLPFLHAIWTGMAGYFIGFAGQFPERKRGLLLVAIGVPAFLHGSYNTFSSGAIALVIALISVLALNLYLAKSVDFEKLLADRRSP
jgi:RsiW-degrading membrane proteinase PrsW (M82 family)